MITTRHTSIRFLVALLLSLMLGLLITLQAWSADDSADQEHGSAIALTELPALQLEGVSEDLQPTNCRYGVGVLESESLPWLPTIGAGWLVNFNPYAINVPNSEFVATLRVKQDKLEGQRLPTYTFTPPLTVLPPNNGSVEHLLKLYPGMLWLIGNEIEIDNSVQDNMMPELYAEAYHEAYHFIKGVDSTAQVSIGSVTMATPGRLQYLDIVWDTYRELYGRDLPVDVWNFHLYILAERNSKNNNASGKIALGTDPNIAIFTSHDIASRCPHPDLPDTPENDPRHDVYCRAERDSLRIYREQVYAMRRWMKDHGLQDVPLIITEYGSLSSYAPDGDPENPCGKAKPDEFGRCMFPERVTDYLVGTSQFLDKTTDPQIGYPQDDYRLVQRWIWYSLFTPWRIGGSSNLLVEDYADFTPGSEAALSMMGWAFRNEALSSARPNLVAGKGASSTVFVDKPGALANATLTALFHNSGELSVTQPFAVSFYSDPGLMQRIGTAVVLPEDNGPIMGCGWGRDDFSQAEIVWENLPVGTYDYWARIDSTYEIDEWSKSDNVTTRGSVTVRSSQAFPNHTFMPLLRGE